MKNTNHPYTKNYQIINGASILDIPNRKIHLKIPLPHSNFKIKKSYNLSMGMCTTVLVHLSDGTATSYRNINVANHIESYTILFSEINLNPSTIPSHGIQILIYNDLAKDFSANDLYKTINLIRNQGYTAYLDLCDDKKDKGEDGEIFIPDEGCGGILTS